MKPQSDLFDSIVDYQNLRNAWIKSIRGKRKSSCVLLFSRNVSANLQIIRDRLLSGAPGWGNYRSFVISEPKKRVISAAPFAERIMHHAIMNVLAPLFERHLIFHTYACRKGKGTQAAVLYAFNQCKGRKFFLKLDARKYFDSIDHNVLKMQLGRLIKDGRILFLLFGIIDSYHVLPDKGLPIGNLTSQFFANLYMSCMDHYVLERIKPTGYVRYMDDFVLWHEDKQTLQTMFALLQSYIVTNLKLDLKPPVSGCSKQGLPFLGFLIKSSGIFLLRKSKRRMLIRAKSVQVALVTGKINEEKAAERANSINAAVIIARSRAFRVKLWRGSGFGH